MARGVAYVCLLALMTASCVHARDLQQSGRTDTRCKASSEATLVLVGSGSGRAKGSSLCEAQAAAEDAIKKVVTDWCDLVFNSKGGCVQVDVQAAVDGIATAYASVLTKVQAEAEIIGTGQACAGGSAEGDAIGAALLDIAIEATVAIVEDKHGQDYAGSFKDAVNKKANSADGSASGRAISAAIASAWSEAYAGVCTEGGAVAVRDESFAQQITQAYAELWASVAIQLCEKSGQDATKLKEWEESLADSTSEVSGRVDSSTQTVTTGKGSTGSGNPLPCEGQVASNCCSIKNRRICDCGAGCTATKQVDDFWSVDGETCFCA